MDNVVRVLIVEDRPEDAELMVHELIRSGLRPLWDRVDTEPDFVAHLQPPPQVILADYRMPELDAPRALMVLEESGLDIPFIVVSGAIGEDVAVAMMRGGAADYLLKDRLARLGPAVKRALNMQKLRQEKRKAEEALRSTEARFQSFMNNSPALAFIKDEEGRILYLNNTAEQMWGTTAAECRGKRDDERWAAAGVAATLRAHDQAVLATGRPLRSMEELTLPDGSARQMLSLRFTFADAAGRRMLGGMAMDITEQKRAEAALSAALAAQRVLLKEVHHRVKNNLQIISSLLSMQARQFDNPLVTGALAETQQRVQSMAMVHEVLYGQGDMGRLDLCRYIQRLAPEVMQTGGALADAIRLRLDLAPVSVDLNQAIPCGLIVNEAITNSLRHAFPDGQSGEILVSLRSEAGRVVLRIADTGIGMPAAGLEAEPKTLGLHIIDILARQLDGKLDRECDTGTTFTVTFPQASANGVHA